MLRLLLFAAVVSSASAAFDAAAPLPPLGAAAPLPPLGSIVTLSPRMLPAFGLRHCDYVASVCPIEEGSDDFRFVIVAALSGAPAPSYSLQSTNFVEMYFAPLVDGDLTLGVYASPDADDATWSFVAGLSDSTNFSLASASKNGAWAGKYVTFGTSNKAPCHYKSPSGDALLSDGGDAAASTFIVRWTPPPPPPPSVTINVSAAAVTHVINPYFIGCHVDPGYAQEPRGWYSQLVYGESFEAGNISGPAYAWNDITAATAVATVALDPTTTFNPAAPAPALSITYTSGSGVAGWSNRGIGNEGMSLVGGKLYDGFVFILAPGGAQLFVAASDHNLSTVLDSATLAVPASPAWQQVAFNLTPSASTTCTGIVPGSVANIDCGRMGPNAGHICIMCTGELQVGLSAPGAAHIGYVFFEPGPWGRLAGLPVLATAAAAVTAMGTRVIRQGGTVSKSFAWKAWRGAPWARASMGFQWRDALVSGWGMFEFLDAAAALGVKPVLTLAADLNSAQDFSDLVEYTLGDASTEWGAVRIVNDSHPAPYEIYDWELGNEQQNPDFVAQVAAMEARRIAIGAPPMHYLYPNNAGVSASQADALTAAGIAAASIAPDCHIGGGGGIACALNNFAGLPNFTQSFINCETNAGISTMKRALEESADLQVWFNFGARVGEDPSRLIARTASFCTERSGHFVAYDQGLSFFLPNMSWLQPPGYVHAMINATAQPNAVRVAAGPYPASAQLSDDATALTVQLVNNLTVAGPVVLALAGFTPASPATIWTLQSADINGANTPASPTAIAPVQSSAPWPAAGGLALTLPPNSFTIVTVTAASRAASSRSAAAA